MSSQIELILFSPDMDVVSHLGSELQNVRHVSVLVGTGPQFFQQHKLDALWMTGMHVTYWGINPMASGTSLVADSPKEKWQQGFPSRVVAGWISSEAYENTPARLGPKFINLLFAAVEEYNQLHPEKAIRRVGSLPDFLGLKGLYEPSALQHLQKRLGMKQGAIAEEPEEVRLVA